MSYPRKPNNLHICIKLDRTLVNKIKKSTKPFSERSNTKDQIEVHEIAKLWNRNGLKNTECFESIFLTDAF